MRRNHIFFLLKWKNNASAGALGFVEIQQHIKAFYMKEGLLKNWVVRMNFSGWKQIKRTLKCTCVHVGWAKQLPAKILVCVILNELDQSRCCHFHPLLTPEQAALASSMFSSLDKCTAKFQVTSVLDMCMTSYNWSVSLRQNTSDSLGLYNKVLQISILVVPQIKGVGLVTSWFLQAGDETRLFDTTKEQIRGKSKD